MTNKKQGKQDKSNDEPKEKISQHDQVKIMELYKNGETPKHIADQLSISIAATRAIIERHLPC